MGLNIAALWQYIVNIAKKDMCNFIPLFRMLDSMGIVWLVYENGFYPWWYRRNMYPVHLNLYFSLIHFVASQKVWQWARSLQEGSIKNSQRQ